MTRFALTANGLATMAALRVSAEELGLFMLVGEWLARSGCRRFVPLDVVCRILNLDEERAQEVATGLVVMGCWGVREHHEGVYALLDNGTWRFEEDE